MSPLNRDSTNPTPAVAAAIDALQAYFLAGQIAANVRPGGAVLEVRILDSVGFARGAFSLPSLPALGPAQSTDPSTPFLFIYVDPAVGSAAF